MASMQLRITGCVLAVSFSFLSSCAETAGPVSALDGKRFFGEPAAVANLTVWPILTREPLAVGDYLTLQEAQSRFLRYLEEPSSLIPDLKGVVYSMAAQGGDQNTHDTLRRLAQEANFQEEKVRLQMALSRFAQPELLERTLEMSLSDEIRSQDTVTLLSAVAGNSHGGTDLAWRFIKDNWAELDRRYGEGGFAMMRLVSITGGFTTPEARQDEEEFFKVHSAPAATRTIQQSLERVDLNIRWLERNRGDMANWFGG